MRATPIPARDQPAPPDSAARPHGHGRRHWEAWVLRALLGALVVWQALSGNREGATVAAMGLAASLIPPVVSRFSGWHVPRMLELTFVLAMVLQYASESLKLFELFTYWDKIVHPTEIFLATAVATYLLLGYRKLHQLDIPDGLAAAGAMLFGMTLGATWELLEFALDWFGRANLQKSNADTMTDILTNDAGAIFGALLAFWLWRHVATDNQKVECGKIADWLTGRLSRLFEDHGFAVGIAVALAVAGIVAAGWMMDRVTPPTPPGQSGGPARWELAEREDVGASVAVVSGEWQPTDHGLCQVSPSGTRPGSEQSGLVLLNPGTAYGAGADFDLSSDYYLTRPDFGSGTAMASGLVFGFRDADNYYVVRADATHDTVALDHYVNGHRRDVREIRLRTRGDEWHTLRVSASGANLRVALDERELFLEPIPPEVAGSVGLWSRVSASDCFAHARVDV